MEISLTMFVYLTGWLKSIKGAHESHPIWAGLFGSLLLMLLSAGIFFLEMVSMKAELCKEIFTLSASRLNYS